MALREIVSSYGSCFQALLPYPQRRRGCPHSDRQALARAFIAKAVFDLATTRMLLDRLRHGSTLRQLCGWSNVPTHSERGDVFARLCRICRQRLAELPARGAHRNAPKVSVCWVISHAIRQRLRGERAVSEAQASSQAEAPARASAQEPDPELDSGARNNPRNRAVCNANRT